jgi:uncharacterized protein (DUF362 family)
MTKNPARVAFVRTSDRADGVRRALLLLGPPDFHGKHVLVKPNLNSADPAPGSTHSTTLRTVVEWLLAQGTTKLTIGDRSGMGNTRDVMSRTSVWDLTRELGLEVVPFDELDAHDWVAVQPPDSHWSQGFMVPRLLGEVDSVVQICNLKTHRFGGHFTLSLKNSVGLAAKTVPGQHHDYMRELHSSSYQREMIAEINVAYHPALILLDGVEAFVTGGPDRGERAATEVILAATDRVAIDAVGVALLRFWGTTPEVKAGPIFGQAQIRRAVELGLGVRSPDEIELVTEDEASRTYATRVRAVLDAG